MSWKPDTRVRITPNTLSDQIWQSCSRVAATEKANCLKDGAAEYRLKQRDNQREYNDLAAQRTSALWTSIMGMAALIGMGLSAIGVALVYTTFQETRRTAQATVEAVYGVERPIIMIAMQPEYEGLVLRDDGHIRIYFDVRNVGKQVGMIYGVSGRFVISSDPAAIPEPATYVGPGEERCVCPVLEEVTLEPGGAPFTYAVDRTGVTEADIAGLADRTLVAFFVVGIMYSDLLEKTRKLTVSYVYDPPRAGDPPGRFLQLTHYETRAEKTNHQVRKEAYMRELRDTMPIFWERWKEPAPELEEATAQERRWYQRHWWYQLIWGQRR